MHKFTHFLNWLKVQGFYKVLIEMKTYIFIHIEKGDGMPQHLGDISGKIIQHI